MRTEWRTAALKSARRYLADQDGMRAVNAAISALAADPDPPESFPYGGEYRRLRVGDYRVLYRVQGDVITIYRVDRVI